MQRSRRIRKIVSLAAKLALTAVGLWFVFRKIDAPALLEELKTAQPFLLVLAAVFFVLSKVIASFRLNTYFRCLGLHLPEAVNLRLYWLGMYYNLFLPGGIGGDGYKVYLLNKQYKLPVKKLVRAVLLDRVSGLVAIVALSLLLVAFPEFPIWLKLGCLAGIPLLYGICHWVVRRFFKDFRGNLMLSNFQSVGVQLAQTACVLLIMLALGIRDHYLPHILIFFISSIVAVLPLTIGGVGAREVVFLFGARHFALDNHQAVAISLLFFGITALVSLCGIFFSFSERQLSGKGETQSG